MKIMTHYECPPIPVHDCDCDEDGFFSLSPVGRGATEAEAIADLMQQLEDA